MKVKDGIFRNKFFRIMENVYLCKQGESMSQLKPAKVTSLTEIWANLNPKPAGVLNQLLNNLETDPALTATIFLPMQCRLVCGREDGSIILVSTGKCKQETFPAKKSTPLLIGYQIKSKELIG